MKRLSPYRISSRVLRILSFAILIMFVAFFIFGYDRYFEEDSRFRAPLLTDTLMAFTAVFVLGTLGVTSWSVVLTVRRRLSSGDNTAGNVPSRIIYVSLTLLVVLLFVVGLLSSSSSPMKVNGELYTNALWLRLADTFVILCLALTVVALGVAAFSSWKSLHK